ncbi:FBD-like protein [Artemisia annua]|uniref:FBD-like protein n=1 Tax=Artemisia annua TaxID=35608 RepID=A0A2U1QHD4_ARTAN|nr:FBD-like protein [Artemisia annua]
MSPRCKKVDRLSSLPEKVHSVILSLMPTKFAVRTSILSKRWRYTWTLIHNLDFDDIRSNSYSHVDRVLMLCKTTCVKILRLHFSKTKIHVPDSTVSRWISEAVRLNVSELDISNVGLPLSLFTCNTLSKLSLKLIEHYNKFSLECPPSIYLPNLKTLDIIAKSERFDYANPISCDNIFKLIHGCPLLEDLSLKIHLPYNTEDLYFKAPTLKRLRLALSYGSSRDIHKVVLNVPNLEYLHIEEGFAKCSLFVMEDLSSLVKAKVSCGVFYNHLWVELVKGLSKVRNLTLDTAKLKTQDRLLGSDVGPNVDLNLLRRSLCDTVPDSQVRGLSGMDVVPPSLDDVLTFLIPISKGRSKKSTVAEVVQVIVSTVRLKLVTLKFKKLTLRSHLLLDSWKIPSACLIHEGSAREGLYSFSLLQGFSLWVFLGKGF